MARNTGAMAEAPPVDRGSVDPQRPEPQGAATDGADPNGVEAGRGAEGPRAAAHRAGSAHRAASPEPATERGRRTRAALIDAARRVFAERGYIDATIADITAAAEVAHGTFYTYFESKRDLFHEVVEALMADFR